MGRAGGGGGGRSGGSRSSSRSSGGHRSSSRAGRSSYHSSRSSSSSRRYSSSTRHYNSHSYSDGYHSIRTPYVRRSTSSPLVYLIATLIAIVIFVSFISLTVSSGLSLRSTRNRDKIASDIPYNSKCIVDELYWFDRSSQTGKDLEYFYNKTGIQPYIVLKAYDETLNTDDEKIAYAEKYYEDNFDNEATFLYMYFAEEDQDGDVGFMCYINGYQVDEVMDTEAVDIFWGYLDNYWYTDMSTDEVFLKTFTKTADTIMTKSKTFEDITHLGLVVILVISVGTITIILISKKRKAEKERAEETERILNTPMQDLASSSTTDDLVDKYQ